MRRGRAGGACADRPRAQVAHEGGSVYGSVAACATVGHCEADSMKMGRNTKHYDIADWLVDLGRAGLRLMSGVASRRASLGSGNSPNPRRAHPRA